MSGFNVIYRTSAAENPCKQPVLTVVLPVCNTGMYLLAALNSLTVQGNIELEIIIVDYLSVDNSRAVAMEFAKEFSYLKIIIVEQTTPGLGDARNYGVQIGTGEYISFLDSDDLVAPDIYPRLIEFARIQNCEMVIAKTIQFEHSTKLSDYSHARWPWVDIMGERAFLVSNAKEDPRLLEVELHMSNRVLRLDFMRNNKILCPENKYYEDLTPHTRAIMTACRIGLVNIVGCFKREARIGQMTSNRGRVSFDALDVADAAISEIEPYKLDARLSSPALYLYLRTVYAGGAIRTYYSQRHEYFNRAVKQFTRFPRVWAGFAQQVRSHHLQHCAMISAFARQDIKLLLMLTAGNPSGLSIFIHFICRGKFLYIWEKRKEIIERIRAA